MRSVLASLAIALSGVGAVACGGAGKDAGAGSQKDARATATGGASAAIPPSSISGGRSFPGDGDGDNPADGDGDGDEVADSDRDNDSPTRESGNYHDRDDGDVLNYGHAAGARDARAITTFLERYYAAAVAGDGATACSMIYPALARSVAEDYGRYGPLYLRGGKTCAAVMALLFEHYHGELAGGITVTGVRVKGEEAYALLGSTTKPASYAILVRGGGAWKMMGLLGGTLH
jgi:hypothetical protein